MEQFVKTFPQFVNESWRPATSAPMIAKEYEATFGDFSFEKNIPELITTLESYWLKLKEKYHWNYSSRGVNKDHFALDVKIHVWPNADKMREILEDPDLGEEEVEHKWYHWLNERAEMFIDQIDHAWIKDAGFAGKSGGWLFIYPVVDDEDFGNNIEEHCQAYQKEKETLKSEEIEALKKYDQMGDYPSLVDIGLADEIEDLKHLEEGVGTIREQFNTYLFELKQMDMDLSKLATRVAKFRLTATKEFYEYLKDDLEFNR